MKTNSSIIDPKSVDETRVKATCDLVSVFADVLEQSGHQSQIETAIDRYIESIRLTAPELLSRVCLALLRRVCQATFRLLKRGEDPGLLLSPILSGDL